MSTPHRTVTEEPERDLRRSQSRHASERHAPKRSSDLRRLVDAVYRSIPVRTIELSDEFYPAHLPVALIDAIFRFRPAPRASHAAFSERYCRHFGIANRRLDLWKPPPADEQETLEDLSRHYDELGATAMADAVFGTRCRFPGTKMTRAEYVCHVARALRRTGINVLQDVQSVFPEAIDDALLPLPGHDEHLGRRLLMYAGDDNFVRGCPRVRAFVARALGRRSISAAEATRLVRQCAHERLLSPRFLDYQIWRHGTSRPSDAPALVRHRPAAA